LEVQRNCLRGYWGEGHATDGSRLIHTPETWCRIALLFTGASGLDGSLLTLLDIFGTSQAGHSSELRDTRER